MHTLCLQDLDTLLTMERLKSHVETQTYIVASCFTVSSGRGSFYLAAMMSPNL